LDGLGLGAQDLPLVFAFRFFRGRPRGRFCGCIQGRVVGGGCVQLGFWASMSGCFGWHAGTFLFFPCILLNAATAAPPMNTSITSSRTARAHRFKVVTSCFYNLSIIYKYCNLKCNVIVWHLRLGIIGAIRRTARMISPSADPKPLPAPNLSRAGSLTGLTLCHVVSQSSLRFLWLNRRPGSDPGNQNKSIGNNFIVRALNLTWNEYFKSLILQTLFFVLF